MPPILHAQRRLVALGLACGVLAGACGGGDDDSTDATSWDHVALVDLLDATATIVDADGEEVRSFALTDEPDASFRLLDGRGRWLVAQNGDELLVADAASEDIERLRLAGDEVVVAPPGAGFTIAIGSPVGSTSLRLFDPASGEVIDVGDALDDSSEEPILLPLAVRQSPDGETLIATDLGPGRVTVIARFGSEPVVVDGLGLGVFDDAVVTRTDTDEVVFWSLDGDELATRSVDPESTFVASTQHLLELTADGQILRSSADDEPTEAGAHGLDTAEPIGAVAVGSGVYAWDEFGAAVVLAADGTVRASFDDDITFPARGTRAGTRCLSVSSTDDDDGTRLRVIDVSTGQVVDEQGGADIAVVGTSSLSGCRIAVVGDPVVAIAPDDAAVITRDDSSYALVRDGETIDLGDGPRLVAFLDL